METKLNEVDFYTSELEWATILINNGVNPYE